MEKVTFDQLPEMVASILEKLARIEDALNIKEHSEPIVKEMLTTDEAVNFLGVSKSTLYKMTYNRTIPFYKPTGGRVYFKREELVSYMQQNRVKSYTEIEQEAINYVTKNPRKYS